MKILIYFKIVDGANNLYELIIVIRKKYMRDFPSENAEKLHTIRIINKKENVFNQFHLFVGSQLSLL